MYIYIHIYVCIYIHISSRGHGQDPDAHNDIGTQSAAESNLISHNV